MSTGDIQEDRSTVMGGSPGTPSSTASDIVDGDQSDISCPNLLACFICMEPPTDPVAGSCGHVFCWPCMHRWLQNRPKPCPVCRYTLRRDFDIIPLYCAGSGASAGPSNSSGSATESTPAADTIPSRPRNPLLVMATASMEGSGNENLTPVDSVLIPNSVITAYERSMREVSDSLVLERDRVRYLTTVRANLALQVNDLQQRNARLRLYVEEKDWQIFVLGYRRREQLEDLEQRNLMLVREVEESGERDRQHIERENEMGEQIARLQERLDQANSLLASG